MLFVVAFVLALELLADLTSGERFLVSHTSVTREEDSLNLNVLPKLLECPSFFPDFYIGNDPSESVPFDVVEVHPFFVGLRFTRPPDAELGDEFYRVLIVCDDRDPTPPPATTTVSVTITSRNEHSPYATQDSFSLSFSEAVEEGDVVGAAGEGVNQYLIEDDDGGEDGRLTYTALDDPHNPYIGLVPETGDLVLLSRLDYEKEGALSTSIEINGCDRATPTVLCPNITVLLTLTPVNDNDPQFAQPEYWVGVEEGLHRATELVSNITCTDADIDEGVYGRIEIGYTTLDFLDILPTSETGRVVLLLTSALDYDFTNNTEFEAELHCYDNAREGGMRNTTAAVHIQVLPANDHPPVFTAEWFNTSVLESLPVDSHLLTVQCSDQDRDFGKFAAISLHQPTPLVNKTFHMGPTSGLLTLTAPLDYDNPATRHHIFTIRCSDNGGREAFSRISIGALPVGDEPVTLQSRIFHFSVDRLTGIGSRIGQVIAIDGDKGEIAAIIYTLEYSDLFDIDDEGYITLTDYLSRDKGDFFNLTVEVRDGQGAAEGWVEISVTGLFSLPGVINVVIGTFGLVVVIIITALVAVCSYYCWKLSRSRHDEPTTEVPVYVRGDNLPVHRPHSAHSRGSGQHVTSGPLRERSTLSMQRTKKKKKGGHSFRKRARQHDFFTNSDPNLNADLDDNQVLFGQNPAEMDMTIFRNEDAMNGTEEEWTKEDEAVGSAQNIFNPEDAGLMLGDIMLFPGEEQPRWNKDDSGNNSVVDMGSWALMTDERGPQMEDETTMEGEGEEGEEEGGGVEGEGEEGDMSDYSEESGGSAEWDLTSRAVTWDSETDSLTLTTI